MEKLILSKYKKYLSQINNISQSQIEELIFCLENEVMNNSFSVDGIIANYIKLLRNVQIRISLTENEKKCIEDLKKGIINDIYYDEEINKKILKRINK